MKAMNRNQKTIVLFALGLAVLIGLFPPWTFVVDKPYIHLSQQGGYSFLLASVEVPAWDTDHDTPMFRDYRGDIQVHLDFERLAVEWITLSIATLFFFLLFKRKA